MNKTHTVQSALLETIKSFIEQRDKEYLNFSLGYKHLQQRTLVHAFLIISYCLKEGSIPSEGPTLCKHGEDCCYMHAFYTLLKMAKEELPRITGCSFKHTSADRNNAKYNVNKVLENLTRNQIGDFLESVDSFNDYLKNCYQPEYKTIRTIGRHNELTIPIYADSEIFGNECDISIEDIINVSGQSKDLNTSNEVLSPSTYCSNVSMAISEISDISSPCDC